MDFSDIADITRKMRCKILDMDYQAKVAHLASALSVVDILATLYWKILKIDPKHQKNPERDRFILSKGHAAMALYSALALKGFIPEEMLGAYLHFGHRRTITHPRMKPFIHTVRNSISIIDLEKTKQYFEEALAFIARVVADGGKILFVATRVPAKDLVRSIAKDLEMFYVAERWLGGNRKPQIR